MFPPGVDALPLFIFAAFLLVALKAGYFIGGFVLLRHPIVAGIIFWAITGNYYVLLAAVFFELFWLDLFYVGTYVPPDGLFAYLLFAPVMISLNLSLPQSVCLPLLLCLPFANIASKMEGRVRMGQSKGHERLSAAVSGRGDIPGVTSSVIRRSLLKVVSFDILVYALSAMAVYGALWVWIWQFGGIYQVGWANWGFLLCLASLGGLLSLRITSARACFLACVAVVGGIYIF